MGELVEGDYIVRDSTKMAPLPKISKVPPFERIRPMPHIDRIPLPARSGWVDALEGL